MPGTFRVIGLYFVINYAFIISSGKRDIADVIKVLDLKIGILSWIIRVGPI